MELPAIDLRLVLSICGKLLAAFLLALPVAWDREERERSLGLRTFPLVAIASAGYVLLAETVLGGGGAARARILQGLMTGVGFLGGGAIVKRGATVRGAATAASIWSTAAVGAAVAHSRYEIALVLTAANFGVLRWLTPLKPIVDHRDDEGESRSGRSE